MAKFSLRLFGPVELTIRDRTITDILTEKERALLAYLVIESGCPHGRETLGSLLWPDRPERAARQSLRQALYQLRRAIGDQDPFPPLLQVNSETIHFKPHIESWVDVAEFTSLLGAIRMHHVDGLSLCGGCAAYLYSAVSTFRGEFMAGFSLRDAQQFDLWQIIHREAYHVQMVDALSMLTRHYLAAEDYPRVVALAQRIIEIEPGQETAHRLLMRSLALQGRRGEALHQFEVCAMILNRELGVDPSTKTSLLYSQIRDELPLDLDENGSGVQSLAA